MNHRTPYPQGSPKDILLRLLRMQREQRRLLADVQSCNDNNPNFADCPIDVGRYVVRIKKTKGVLDAVKAVIAAGEPKLPAEILDPIIEPW